jgi:hypothetical protein
VCPKSLRRLSGGRRRRVDDAALEGVRPGGLVRSDPVLAVRRVAAHPEERSVNRVEDKVDAEGHANLAADGCVPVDQLHAVHERNRAEDLGIDSVRCLGSESNQNAAVQTAVTSSGKSLPDVSARSRSASSMAAPFGRSR